VAQAEFDGHASGEVSKLSRSIVLERAARDAVGKFLESITPRWVTRSVPLDDEDPAQAPWLETARAGAIASAASEATRYLQQNPGNPSAAYNLAVLLDAMGDYEQALAMYDRSLAAEKPFYREAREGCARRLAAQRALESGPVPASLAPRSR
jgi:tetratricopeptide (TPR) repeat protein